MGDALVVFCFSDVSYAGCIAELYMMTEAGSFWEFFAGADAKCFADKAEEVVSFLCGNKWSIDFPVFLVSSDELYSWKWFVGYMYIGESFCIFEVDIVFGLMAFDEGAFKYDCFEFGVGCDGFDGGCLVKHGLCFWIEWLSGKIAFYSFF